MSSASLESPLDERLRRRRLDFYVTLRELLDLAGCAAYTGDAETGNAEMGDAEMGDACIDWAEMDKALPDWLVSMRRTDRVGLRESDCNETE